MPYSIQFRFDDEASRRILALAEDIESLGAVNLYKEHAAVPHIAVSVAGGLNLEKTKEDLMSLQLKRFPVLFSFLGSFPGDENVIFLSPKVDSILLDAHKTITGSLTALEKPYTYYEKDFWVPHCTIGINIPQDILGESFAKAHKIFSPFQADIAEICITRFRPNVTLYTQEMP